MSADLQPRLFGAVERRLFRATAVVFMVIALGVLIAGILWVLGKTLSHFYNLIMPLSVAGIVALVLNPVVDHLERRRRMSRVAATSIIVVLFVTIIVGALVMVVPTLVRQVAQFTETAPGLLTGWLQYLSNRFPGMTLMVMDSAKDGEIKELVPDMGGTGRTVRSYAGLLMGLSFVPLFLFFTLLSGGRLRGKIMSLLSIFSAGTQKNIMHLIDVFIAQLTGFFRGQLVIAVIMGTMFSIGFTLIGLKGGILVGLLLGLLNIVPFLGTLVGLLVVLPLAYFQPTGSFQLVGLSLLVFTIVQLVESWLLTPKIMADRSGLHPALVLIAVFFWGTALGGITGMILAVPLTAFLVAVWHQAKAALTLSMTSDHDADRIVILTDTDEPSSAKAALNDLQKSRSTSLRPSSTRKE